MPTTQSNLPIGATPRPGYVVVPARLEKESLVKVNALMGKANADPISLAGSYYEIGTLVYLNFYGQGELEGEVGQPFTLVFRGIMEFRIVPPGSAEIPPDQRGDFFPLLLATQQA